MLVEGDADRPVIVTGTDLLKPKFRVKKKDQKMIPKNEDLARALTRETQPENKAKDKTLGNTDVNGARKNVKDIVVFGNGDLFKLLAKASSEAEGWMKSTKAMATAKGCAVQVTTQQRNPDGTYSIAEALTFVPGVFIDEDEHGNRYLRSIDG